MGFIIIYIFLVRGDEIYFFSVLFGETISDEINLEEKIARFVKSIMIAVGVVVFVLSATQRHHQQQYTQSLSALIHPRERY